MTTQKSNAEKFVEIYKKLENWLAETVNPENENFTTDENGKCNYKRMDFAKLLKKFKTSHKLPNGCEHWLCTYAHLRNVIVHGEGKNEKSLAEPHDEVVEKFRQLADTIMTMDKVSEIGCKPDILLPSDLLRKVLTDMRNHKYSQVVVHTKGTHVLLSYATIAAWLASTTETTIDLTRTHLSCVLNARVDESEAAILPPDASLFKALACLSNPGNRIIQAVLVCKDGDPRNAPMRIITHADIYECLVNRGLVGSSANRVGTNSVTLLDGKRRPQ